MDMSRNALKRSGRGLLRHSVGVASFASLRRRLVKQHIFAIHFALELMARTACDILVSTLQREFSLLVIKQRRLPLIGVVALRALERPFAELLGMRILVALIASYRRIGEVHMDHVPFHVGGLVAVDALHRPMRSIESKLRGRVIEPGHVVPVLGLVARLASHRLAVRREHRHALRKLSMMDVFMACRAGNGVEVIKSYRRTQHRLMAIVAGNGHVRASQRIRALLVHRDGVICDFPGGAVVALLAPVLPRGGRELAVVFILVAIETVRKRYLVNRLLSRRDMALGALHLVMRRHQCELCPGVLDRRKRRGLPALDRVATLTLSSVCALGKLPAMRIRLMTIGTKLIGDRSFEVCCLVAINATHFGVLAQERKGRRRVVEGCLESRLFPCRRRVARCAVLFELALVRVRMAGRASVKLKARVARPPVSAGGMALLAGNGSMQPRERIMRRGVIEALLFDLGVFPIGRVMALRAGGPEAALVLVLVASHALRRKAEVAMTQVLLLQESAGRCGNILRLVARTACHADVLPIQGESGLGVIESLRRRIPVQHREILAVVVGMAFYASFTGSAFIRKSAVQPAMLLQLRGNLAVAFGTAERSLAHRLGMALGAVSRSLQIVMWTRQGSGGNLRMRRPRNSQQDQQDHGRAGLFHEPVEESIETGCRSWFRCKSNYTPPLGEATAHIGERS
jgi:hypothetical protein